MKVADFTPDELKEFIHDSVWEALQQWFSASENATWLDTSAHDLARGIAVAEATVSEKELDTWLNMMEKSVKPLEGVSG